MLDQGREWITDYARGSTLKMLEFVVFNAAGYKKIRQHPTSNIKRLGQIAASSKVHQNVHSMSPAFDASKRSFYEELLDQLHNASTRDEYRAAAHLLDRIEGHELWKADDNSDTFPGDFEELEKSIYDFTCATKLRNIERLRYLLMTTLRRDISEINALTMYKHSWSGTKRLTEDYIKVVVAAIRQVVDYSCSSQPDLLELASSLDCMRSALTSYGRSALAISGGALMGMKSIGVAKALWEVSLLPKIIYGASAGSIVAAVACTRHNSELGLALEKFPTSDLACFDPPNTTTLGWWSYRISNTFYRNRPFHMDNMVRVTQSWVGILTFQEAYNLSGRILNISVSSASSSQSYILNKDSAPNVLIWSAVCASCSVPGLFPVAIIYTKDPITKEIKPWMKAQNGFLDGSLYQDIPTKHMISMYNINWLIVSQVNPHARFFISLLGYEKDFAGNTPEHSWRTRLWEARLPVARLLRTGLRTGVNILEALHVPLLHYTGLHVLTQDYVGDIDVFPEIHIREDWALLSNPTPEYLKRATFLGEKATWPKLWRIENSLAIELALAKAVSDLKQYEIDVTRRDREARSRSTSVERQFQRGSSTSVPPEQELFRQRSRSFQRLDTLAREGVMNSRASTRRSRISGTFEPLSMTTLKKN